VSVAAAVLAAGEGSRFAADHPKPLALLGGRPLVDWALDAALESALSPVLVVVGNAAKAVSATVPDSVRVVVADDWDAGIAHSLRAALEALEDDPVTAVCIGLADQPLVGAEAYRRLAAAHQAGAELAVSTYDGERGNPVLLGRSLWSAALTLEGDVGARALMADNPVEEVDCTGTGDPRDVDTLDDLRALDEQEPEGT
jgi:CTP:molybdopterin cytidylyltransferase MocA